MGSKRVKMGKEEDRISALPDSIIQHILSFLPSTKEAIRTGILSKRWQNQWTHVPILIFDSNFTGMSYENFLKFIEYALIFHDCSKIKKFHLKYHYPNAKDPHFAAKIRFATRKHVEELKLSSKTQELLPTFLFNHASLVKLNTMGCTFTPKGKVNWGCLTALNILCCELSDRAMEHILSGSPSLESLELSRTFFKFDKLVIASKSLKRLVLGNLATYNGALEISCPKLEQLKLFNCLMFETAKLLNLPSSLCATIDVYFPGEELQIPMIREILQSLQHVKHLEIGTPFIMVLSDLELKGGLVLPMLNIKCLILDSFDLNEYPCGIASLLRNSPLLEKLVIKAPHYHGLIPKYKHHHENYDYQEKLNEFGENYWNSNASVFNCLVSHLKTIKIIGFPRRDHNRKLVLNFVQFLLKNARVLEKMVVQLKDETTFMLKVSQELLSLPRCSRHAIIECCYAC